MTETGSDLAPRPDTLLGVHPDLIARIVRVLDAMAALGFPMVVTDGVRTAEQQHDLWTQGRTRPGPIVTQCDGYTRRSNHQVAEDGFGHAVDCAFLVDGTPSWSGTLPWETYGSCGKATGLHWGGDWVHATDRPHVELPQAQT